MKIINNYRLIPYENMNEEQIKWYHFSNLPISYFGKPGDTLFSLDFNKMTIAQINKGLELGALFIHNADAVKTSGEVSIVFEWLDYLSNNCEEITVEYFYNIDRKCFTYTATPKGETVFLDLAMRIRNYSEINEMIQEINELIKENVDDPEKQIDLMWED